MATKTQYIPRFLLPQYGPMWRTAARNAAFPRPFEAGIATGQVRYASKASPAKAGASKAASKASKASAPTKPPSKASPAPKSPPALRAAPKTAPKAALKTAASPKAPAAAAAAAKPLKSEPAFEPMPPAAAKPATPKTVAAAAAAAAPPPAAPAAPITENQPPAPAPKPATAAGTEKPIVLEKPERFNPPSHGRRLPRAMPKHYGGGPTTEEVSAQKARQYPGLPPPENTWSHWFINSRSIHLIITLGTLSTLAVYTFASNFNEKSPYAELVPPISELPRHPIQYLSICLDVLRMHEEHESTQTAEKRRRKVEDVAKRNEYRKAHGMEPAHGFTPWNTPGTTETAPENTEPSVPADNQSPVRAAESEAESKAEAAAAEFTPDGKRKKFLGVF